MFIALFPTLILLAVREKRFGQAVVGPCVPGFRGVLAILCGWFAKRWDAVAGKASKLVRQIAHAGASLGAWGSAYVSVWKACSMITSIPKRGFATCRCDGLSKHVFGNVLGGVEKVADDDVVFFDSEKDDVRLEAIAAIAGTEMIDAKGDAGKQREKLEGFNEPGLVETGLMPPEIELGVAEDKAKLDRRRFA